MNVLFRVDSSFEMGMGHLMRCLTLASALKERGATCRFVCRNHAGASLQLVRERGFDLKVLPLEADRADLSNSDLMHAAWVGGDSREDANATVNAVGRNPPDWVVVDHYGLDASWELVLRDLGCRLLVIDDLADRPHDCDLLLDQTPGRVANDYVPWLHHETELLLGGRYALLRPEFAEYRKAALERRVVGRMEHILISMGGSDPEGVTAHVLDALEALPAAASFRVTTVMNSRSPALDDVRKRAEHASRDTRVLCDVKDMASLMVESDLAIGGAGTTSWERCCLGLPSILAVLAENQVLISSRLEEAGAATVLRELPGTETFRNQLAMKLNALHSSSAQLERMSQQAATLVDGLGTYRLIERMEPE